MSEYSTYLWWMAQLCGAIVLAVVTAFIKDWIIRTFSAANSKRKKKLNDKLEKELVRLAYRSINKDLIAPLVVVGFRLLYGWIILIPLLLVLLVPALFPNTILAQSEAANWVYRSVLSVSGILILLLSYAQTRLAIRFSDYSANAMNHFARLRELRDRLVEADPTVDVTSIDAIIQQLRAEKLEIVTASGLDVLSNRGRLPRVPTKAEGAE